ncbi:MAG: HAD family hydrolase [Candidatus Omnitrophota bacterium]|nr:HAD family hydrolase [Candidatus Omnitrophota bacterium]
MSNKCDIKLVIFDLDGTLIDAYRAIIRSFNHAMRELNYCSQSGLVIRRAVGWGDSNLLAPFVEPGQLKKAVILYRRHHKKSLLEDSRLLPRAKRVLSYLKARGYLLAVASNRPTKFSRILIRHLGLEKYFAYVLCADKLKAGKPHPEILNKIRKKFLLRKNEVLYIGDMVIDAQAGRRAGIRTIIVSGGSSTQSQIRKQRPWKMARGLVSLQKLL